MDSRPTHLASALVDHELAGGVASLGTVYDKSFAQLSPVIGARGVRGIFARGVELAQKEHPELRAFVLRQEPEAAAAELGACLAHLAPHAARDIGIALYSAYLGLLVNFVGLELTIRLLQLAWPRVDLKETQ